MEGAAVPPNITCLCTRWPPPSLPAEKQERVLKDRQNLRLAIHINFPYPLYGEQCIVKAMDEDDDDIAEQDEDDVEPQGQLQVLQLLHHYQ